MKIIEGILNAGFVTTLVLLWGFQYASLVGPKWLLFHTIVFVGYLVFMITLGIIYNKTNKESD